MAGIAGTGAARMAGRACRPVGSRGYPTACHASHGRAKNERIKGTMNIPLTPIRFLRYARQQFPGKTAIVCGDQRFTYAQFADRASRLACALRAMGVQPGDRVAFLSANCHRLLEAYFGALEAGAVLLPLNIRLTPQELGYILTDAGVKVLFLEEQFLGIAESFRLEARCVESYILLDGRPSASWMQPANYEDLLASSAPHQADLMQIDENA